MTMNFSWGGNTGIATPEELKNRRAIADALAQRAGGYAQSVPEGVGQLALGVVSALMRAKANSDETAGRASATQAFNDSPIIRGLFGDAQAGQTFQPAAVPSPVAGAPVANPNSGTATQWGGKPLGGTESVGGKAGSDLLPGSAGNDTLGVNKAVKVLAKDPFGIARSMLGKNERVDHAALKDYLTTGGANLDPATAAWCAAFVNATLAKAGIQGTGSNLARSFLKFGKGVDKPQKGDIAVFSRGDPNGIYGHVGFFQGYGPDGSIQVLGGNQGNIGEVSVRNYPAARLLGFRRPDGVMAGAESQPTMAGNAGQDTLIQPAAGAPPMANQNIMQALFRRASPELEAAAQASARQGGTGAIPLPAERARVAAALQQPAQGNWQNAPAVAQNPPVGGNLPPQPLSAAQPPQAAPAPVSAVPAGGQQPPANPQAVVAQASDFMLQNPDMAVQQAMQIINNPYSTPGQVAITKMALENAIQQADPMTRIKLQQAQLDLRKSEIELQKAQQPAQKDPISVPQGNTLVDPTTGKPIYTNPKPNENAAAASDPKFLAGVRKEVQDLPEVKNYMAAAPIYQSMVDTAGRNTRASDLNIVYGLGKIMDPTSVVREGEMVMVRNTASLPDWLVGVINSLNGGAGLTTETRRAIMREAKSRMDAYTSEVNKSRDYYSGIASRQGFNLDDVWRPLPTLPDYIASTTEAGSATPDEALIQKTMQVRGMSREQAIEQLRKYPPVEQGNGAAPSIDDILKKYPAGGQGG